MKDLTETDRHYIQTDILGYGDAIAFKSLVAIKESFSACSERLHAYLYNTSNFYEVWTEKANVMIALPATHPFHIFILLIFCGGLIISPIGYWSIFR